MASDPSVLEAVLDSWHRNNTILVNFLRAIPDAGLEVRPMESSPSIGKLFTHIHYVRLVFVLEDAPEFARSMPEGEWSVERDVGRLVEMLNDSAKAVCDAVKHRVESGREMNLHYDHPILMLQHMIWHEGYHHGQMKLALKLAGQTMTDEEAGPITWRVWMRKNRAPVSESGGPGERLQIRSEGEALTIIGLDHVQLAMPAGQEDSARRFYIGPLGFREVPKPDHLASGGGAWVENDGTKVHLGVDPEFRPAKKAHPAFLVTDLEQVVAILRQAGCPVVAGEPLEGYSHVYAEDPFGNRLELMQRLDRSE
jgi:catechol 2,3-dioxygenase-like lactoylglutathione lyase family enzyme/uncharacterized damage-inducible protein DinB